MAPELELPSRVLKRVHPDRLLRFAALTELPGVIPDKAHRWQQRPDTKIAGLHIERCDGNDRRKAFFQSPAFI